MNKPCPNCGSTDYFPCADGATCCDICGEWFFWMQDEPEPKPEPPPPRLDPVPAITHEPPPWELGS